MNETQNTPELRFEGFTEPWGQRKVADVANRFDNLRVPVTASLRVPGTTPYYGANGIQDYVEGSTHDGEFVLVAEDGANDLKNYPVRFVNGRIWVNNHAHVLQAKSEIADNKYLAYSISQVNIESLLVGGGRAKLNAEALMGINFYLPTFAEQKAIGDYFAAFDSLITLHQCKHERLQHLKHALLLKMFPKPGEQVPELRFDGFTEPWKEYRLGDLGEVAMCKRIYKDQTSDSGDVPFFKIGTFGGKPDAYISNELFEEYRSKFPFPDAGDVLISAAGTIGRTVVYNGERAYYQDSNIVWLKHGDEINNLFFLQFLKVKDWKNLEGSTLKRLYNKDILETPIALPETAEQNAVGSFFRDIDSLITLHQRKYERLKRLKQALLRKMFV